MDNEEPAAAFKVPYSSWAKTKLSSPRVKFRSMYSRRFSYWIEGCNLAIAFRRKTIPHERPSCILSGWTMTSGKIVCASVSQVWTTSGSGNFFCSRPRRLYSQSTCQPSNTGLKCSASLWVRARSLMFTSKRSASRSKNPARAGITFVRIVRGCIALPASMILTLFPPVLTPSRLVLCMRFKRARPTQ